MSAITMGDGRGTQGLRWAVVTGKVNLQKQVNDAIDTYRDTLPPFDPARDIPEVVWFQVERAEVDAKADADHPDWSSVNVKKMWRIYDEWRGVGREVVPDNFIYSSKNFSLVFPLPPMGEEHVWGDEVAHVPEVPRLVVRDDRLGPNPGFPRPGDRKKPKPKPAANAETTKPAEGPAADEPDKPDAPPDANGPEEGPTPPGAAAAPAPGGGPAGPITRPPKMGLAMGGERKGFGPMGFAPGGVKMPGAVVGGGDRDQLSPWRLFRFFDFTVQPGKRYRYHVQLWWRNPNYGIPGQYLANPDDAKEAYVKTEWSAACEPVEVPRDARLLAGEIVKDHRDQCKVGIAYFDLTSGSEAFDLLDAARGQWLNFYGKIPRTQEQSRHFIAPPGQGQGPKGPPPPPSPHPKSGSHGSGSHSASSGHHPPPPPPRPSTRHDTVPPAAKDVTETKVDYITDTLLLDVAGGAKILPSRDVNLREPGHVLLLDPQGNLVVLHELTDEEEIKSLGGGPHPDSDKKKKSNTKTKKSNSGDDLNKLMSPPTPPPPAKKSSKKSGGG